MLPPKWLLAALMRLLPVSLSGARYSWSPVVSKLPVRVMAAPFASRLRPSMPPSARVPLVSSTMSLPVAKSWPPKRLPVLPRVMSLLTPLSTAVTRVLPVTCSAPLLDSALRVTRFRSPPTVPATALMRLSTLPRLAAPCTSNCTAPCREPLLP